MPRKEKGGDVAPIGRGAKKSARTGKQTPLDMVYGKLMGPKVTVTVVKGDQALFERIDQILKPRD